MDAYGETEIIITATNPFRSIVRDTIELIINPVNDIPYFLSSLDYVVGFDIEFNIELEATDVESQSLAFSFLETESYPDWIYLQDQQIFGNPTELGHFYVPLSLNDGDTIIIDTVELQVERFKPEILSISDIPDDQGGNVELSFFPSFLDNGENFNQSYSIFRYDLIEPDSSGWVSLGSVDD